MMHPRRHSPTLHVRSAREQPLYLTLLLTFYLLLPNSIQMPLNTIEPKKKNITNDEIKNLTTVNNKEYQELHDRFRRTNDASKNDTTDTENVVNPTLNKTEIRDISQTVKYHYNLDNQTNKDEINMLNLNDLSTLAKLIDDSARTKILYDYFKTINNYSEKDEESNTDIGVMKQAPSFNEVNETNGNSSEIQSQGESEPGRTAYEMFLSAVNVSRSSVTSLSEVTRTPKPTFVDGIPKSRSNRILSILGLFELSVGDTPRADGFSELTAARLAVDHVNKRKLLPGYKLHLIVNDTKCDPGVGVDRLFHALFMKRETKMVMVLGTACSDVTQNIANIVPYWNIVQVSPGSTSPALSDRSKFPLFYRTVAPDSSHNTARIAFIKQFGWDTVTTFSQNKKVYSLAVNELVTQLEAANISCTASITFAANDFRKQLTLLKKLDTRIIVGSFSDEIFNEIFCEVYKLGMIGAGYAWLVSNAPPRILGTAPCAREHLAQALEGLVIVTAHKGIAGDAISFSGLTNKMFNQQMEVAGAPVSLYSTETYDAVWAIALALSKAEHLWRNLEMTDHSGTLLKGGSRLRLGYFDYDRKDMTAEFLNQLTNLRFLGVSGPLSFNGADRVGTTAIHQIQGGSCKTIALYTDGRKKRCSNCSQPQWPGGVPVARSVLVPRVVSVWAPARYAVYTMAATGIAIAVAFLVFNLHYRKRQSIKLSSPRLNNMVVLGCIVVYVAVALLGIDSATLPSYLSFSAMCTGRVFIFSGGFSLAFGSMFAKTYRVYRIFISNGSGHRTTKSLQDTSLILKVCVLLFIDVVIVTLWATLDPMERHFQNLTIEINSTNRSIIYQPQIEVCQSQKTTGWLCVLYAYKGLLLLVGVYMAWKTRNVKISELNDSNYIGVCVYYVVITSILVVVIGTITSERATLAFISITSLIIFTTTSILYLLFFPKIIVIWRKTDKNAVTPSMGLKLENKTRRFPTNETQELRLRAEIQNKVLKRTVGELDSEIQKLEELVALQSSTSSSSIALNRRTELNTVEEVEEHNDAESLPMVLLSVLPPVAPRASWPLADSHRRRKSSVTFSSQPKLDYDSEQASDLYNLCPNKKEQPGLLKRLKSLIGSRPSSKKASTMSIADPTGTGIAAALKMHVETIAGLAKSGPIIRVTDEEPSCSNYQSEVRRISSEPQKFIADSETRVDFILPTIHKQPLSDLNSSTKIKGSPRFPHRISPSGASLTSLHRRKTSASVYNISERIVDEQRCFSYQNVSEEPTG